MVSKREKINRCEIVHLFFKLIKMEFSKLEILKLAEMGKDHPHLVKVLREKIQKYNEGKNYWEVGATKSEIRAWLDGKDLKIFYNMFPILPLNHPDTEFTGVNGIKIKLGDTVAYGEYSSSLRTGKVAKECKNSILLYIDGYETWTNRRLIYKRKIHEQCLKIKGGAV